jgi:hypothetical protein
MQKAIDRTTLRFKSPGLSAEAAFCIPTRAPLLFACRSNTATNEARQKTESRCECLKWVGTIKSAYLRVNLCERPMTRRSFSVLLPRQVTHEQLAGRMLAADAKLQLTLQSEFDDVHGYTRSDT